MNNEDNSPRFIVLHREILTCKELTDTDRIVYARICTFDIYFESSEACAQFLGKSERVIQEAKRKLERLGFIECVENTGRGKKYRAVYDRQVSKEKLEKLDAKSEDLQENVGQTYTKTELRPTSKRNSDLHQNVDIVIERDKSLEESNNATLMPALPKPAPARQIPTEAYQLAERLHKWILRNKPDRKIQENWKQRWAEDIDKMHRIDGRNWRQIAGAIDWSQRDDFWHQNILSGANLRKHYDRIEDRARLEMEQNGSQVLADAIQNMTNEQAVAVAHAQGLI